MNSETHIQVNKLHTHKKISFGATQIHKYMCRSNLFGFVSRQLMLSKIGKKLQVNCVRLDDVETIEKLMNEINTFKH
jgi:hypothetical protein